VFADLECGTQFVEEQAAEEGTVRNFVRGWAG